MQQDAPKCLNRVCGNNFFFLDATIWPQKHLNIRPLWERLSATFAKGTTGAINVFQSATTGVKLSSIWRTVEYPILNNWKKFSYIS